MLDIVNTILCISENPNSVLQDLNKYVLLKADLFGPHYICLGTRLKLVQLKNGVWPWGFSPSKNFRGATKIPGFSIQVLTTTA